jgi:hypothetical protein
MNAPTLERFTTIKSREIRPGDQLYYGQRRVCVKTVEYSKVTFFSYVIDRDHSGKLNFATRPDGTYVQRIDAVN